jgi:hypothetical protein
MHHLPLYIKLGAVSNAKFDTARSFILKICIAVGKEKNDAPVLPRASNCKAI